MPPTLLNTKELADRLGYRYGDVLEWSRDGLIPSIKVSGNYFFDLSRVVKALRARKSEPAEAATCA